MWWYCNIIWDSFWKRKICLDDLTVDLCNGTGVLGSIHHVPLNVESGSSPGEGESVNCPAFEGMEALARAIELGECVCICVPRAM